MKKNRLLYIVIGLSIHLFSSAAATLTSITDEMLSSANQISIVMGDSHVNQQRLETLQAEYNELKNDKKFLNQLDQEKRDIKEEIADTKHLLQKASSDFVSQKFTLLNKYDQMLLDLGDARRQYIDITKQHIDYLENYLKSDHSDYGGAKKSIYSFDDLHDLTKKIAAQEDALYELQLNKDDANASIERLNRSLVSYEKQLKEIAQNVSNLKEQAGYIKDDIALLDLEEECASIGKRAASIQIDKHRKMIQFVDSRVFVAQNQLQLLKESLNNVRMHLRIDISDVASYEEKYNVVKRESQVKKADFIKQRNDLTAQKKKLQDDFEELMEDFELSQSHMQQIEGWDLPDETIQEMYEAARVADLKTSIATIDRRLDKIQVSILLEDSKIMQAKTEFDVIGALYSITQVQLKDNDYIDSERDIYKDLQASLTVQLKVDKDNISAAHAYIKSQHKALSNIKKIEDKLGSRRLYREEHKQASDIESSLRSASKSLSVQNGLSVKLSELHTQVLVNHEQALGTINFIVKEFELAGVWHRSNRAITWKGIKLVIPNLILFASHIKTVIVSYISLFTITNAQDYIKSVKPAEIFSILFILLLLFVLFVLLQTIISYLHVVTRKAALRDKDSFWMNIVGLILEFTHSHFFVFYGWITLWLFSIQYRWPIALLIILYAASAILLIYYSRLFLSLFIEINKKKKNLLLNKRFEPRFSFIFSFFSTSTVVILFLRKLFMLVMLYQQSEFPTILLRLYHVVIFISIVFSIDKEELLQLFPKKGLVSQKISDFINHYYSMILVSGLGILIISDPYLGGYGTLVWHVIINAVLTTIAMLSLYFIHQFIKRYSILIFFKEDDEYESALERFDYAKTWYAIYVVSIFGLHLLSALFICSKIWGYGITYDQAMDFLHYGVFRVSAIDKTGKAIESYLTIGSILKIILTSLSGFMFAHLFNQFILKKIFEIQYVDPGVQNTVTTISRYCIIITMTMVAFARADLGYLVTWGLGIGLLTFGWSFKDLFTDVVAYFFILVQRPIKLGDYVRLDDDTMGVVRKISPRAVILRRKNSVTIVIPNSQILKTALYNWNYTRSFLAFDDIEFSVPFTANVVRVREILLKILEEHPEVLKVPETIVRLNDFGDKGYVFLVRGFLSFSNTLNQWDIRSDIRFKIVEALSAEGIRVAEPVLRVNMKEQGSDKIKE